MALARCWWHMEACRDCVLRRMLRCSCGWSPQIHPRCRWSVDRFFFFLVVRDSIAAILVLRRPAPETRPRQMKPMRCLLSCVSMGRCLLVFTPAPCFDALAAAVVAPQAAGSCSVALTDNLPAAVEWNERVSDRCELPMSERASSTLAPRAHLVARGVGTFAPQSHPFGARFPKMLVVLSFF